MTYTATILRGKDGTIYIRVKKDGPDTKGEQIAEVIEILHGEDEDELKERATQYARQVVE